VPNDDSVTYVEYIEGLPTPFTSQIEGRIELTT
jgi:hypothetical protein